MDQQQQLDRIRDCQRKLGHLLNWRIRNGLDDTPGSARLNEAILSLLAADEEISNEIPPKK